MSFNLISSEMLLFKLVQSPFCLIKSDCTIGRVQRLKSRWYEWIVDCSGNVEASLRRELVSVIEVTLYDSLDNINAFFTFEYADFVACVRK